MFIVSTRHADAKSSDAPGGRNSPSRRSNQIADRLRIKKKFTLTSRKSARRHRRSIEATRLGLDQAVADGIADDGGG